MDALGAPAGGGGGGAGAVGGGVGGARPAGGLAPLGLVGGGGAGEAPPARARVVGARQARVWGGLEMGARTRYLSYFTGSFGSDLVLLVGH